ncbi:MAG: PAS domain S-box protein [Burkholderiaceae bacterium]|nr:PAS domain S-box protein [Sulfuritalea sp.]MCF8173973.1 PAS domain S-box protein [Burkholderiaceae bacterium]
MNSIFSRKLSDGAEMRRIEILFDSLPSSIVVVLIGVFLCALVLFGTVDLDILKAWAVYMLSVMGVRAWIWYMFSKADRDSETVNRWEWLFAFGALLTGLGWGALLGPLYPGQAHQDIQMFIALMVVITAFTGSVFVALSNITFWLFIIPTLGPAIALYVSTFAGAAQWPPIAAASCIAVFIIVQRSLYRSGTGRIQRSTEAESLLEEQQAIFESSPMGIAVISNKKVLKCNARLGELLGRRIQEITGSRIDSYFATDIEADQFLADSAQAFDKGHVTQGMYRLCRANGTQFWAEFSGRKMAGGAANGVWMIADVSLRVASGQQAPQHD